MRERGIPPPVQNVEAQTLQGIQRPRKHSIIDSKALCSVVYQGRRWRRRSGRYGERRTTFYSGAASCTTFQGYGIRLLVNIHDNKKGLYTYQQLYFPGPFRAQR